MTKWIWKKYNCNPTYKWTKYRQEIASTLIETDHPNQMYSRHNWGSIRYKYKAVEIKNGQIQGKGETYWQWPGSDSFVVYFYDNKWLKVRVSGYTAYCYELTIKKVKEGEVSSAEKSTYPNSEQVGDYFYEFIGVTYSQGSYVEEVTADYNAYTNNTRNSDGYWYVRDREANQAPKLIGDFKDLGTKNSAFTLEFQVEDQDTDQALKATIRLNGSQIKVFENMTRRQSYEINITNELLKDLEFNKRNTINISLTDGNVTVEENFYFTRTNRPPEITVANSNMGTQNKEFKITFSATDPDGDAMTAKIYIDGVQIEDLGAITAGQEKAYSIKREDFITLKNGEHKIRIDIIDAEGSQSSSFITFTKMVTWYLYEYTEELGNMGVDIRIDMLASLAEGIERKIEVCNNALDTNPTWETIEEGKWVKFANTTKTAAKWGLGVRVRVDRGTATQDSYIYGFNIAYA